MVDIFCVPTGLWGPEADVSGRPVTGVERGGGPGSKGRQAPALGINVAGHALALCGSRQGLGLGGGVWRSQRDRVRRGRLWGRGEVGCVVERASGYGH